MKKHIPFLSSVLCMCMLVGCAGTPVIYHTDCDCPTDGVEASAPQGTDTQAPNVVIPTGALRTGLALVSDIGGSSSATEEKNGVAKYDITMVAVLVDEGGVIRDCIIDGISADLTFDNEGQISSDLTAAPQTKNELGANYGMVAYGGAKYEWNKQAEALADFAVGKTADELRNGAIDESGKAPAGSDLASSATIYLAGYVAAIETAVTNATHLGAQGGDSLCMASLSDVAGSTSAAEGDGSAQLEVTVTALTMKDGTITSCVLDSVQAKVGFDAKGTLTTDLSAPVKTKNELGADYGMVAWGGAIAEWNAQAASFAAYVVGKTPAEVADIAVNEATKPTEADLASSVTIAIGGFQDLIEKAAQ